MRHFVLLVRRDALLFPPPAEQGSASTSSDNVLCYSYGETLYCSHHQQGREARQLAAIMFCVIRTERRFTVPTTSRAGQRVN